MVLDRYSGTKVSSNLAYGAVRLNDLPAPSNGTTTPQLKMRRGFGRRGYTTTIPRRTRANTSATSSRGFHFGSNMCTPTTGTSFSKVPLAGRGSRDYLPVYQTATVHSPAVHSTSSIRVVTSVSRSVPTSHNDPFSLLMYTLPRMGNVCRFSTMPFTIASGLLKRSLSIRIFIFQIRVLISSPEICG